MKPATVSAARRRAGRSVAEVLIGSSLGPGRKADATQAHYPGDHPDRSPGRSDLLRGMARMD
ncbi:hypothetical protein GCM10012276_16750 [Nocardioides deserti]|nr:hypothetical protein GCM10012276_16750 [Nocardioides deserti]